MKAQQSAKMTTFCFFNRTPLEIPTTVLRTLQQKCPVDMNDKYEDYFEQLTLMEEDLGKFSIGGAIYPRTIEKAAALRGMDSARFTSIWTTMVYTLVKVGRIKDDNDNGFLVIEGDDSFLKNIGGDNQEMVCGLCRAPSKLKCGKCGQRYCCKEHQVLDWKKHKKECHGCLTPEQWKNHFSKKLREMP